MESTAVLEQVKSTFAEKILEGYDQPTTNTIDPTQYQVRPFRFYLDNLISILEKVHREYNIVRNETTNTNDMVMRELNRFTAVCKHGTDANIARIFHTFAMKYSPRVAWWVVSSSDWIGNVAKTSIDLSAIAQSASGKSAPGLPIGIIYNEAVTLRTRAESDPEVMAPEHAVLATKIAKYFYAAMKESVDVISPDPDQGEIARTKQCARKLAVIAASLEEASGEDEDFIDIILGAIPNNTVGPDGQRLSTKAIKKGLGGVMNTGVMYDIIKSIPEALSGATDEQSAKDNLLNNPSIKRILQAGGKENSIDQMLDFMKGYGVVPTGESTTAPINTTVSAATASSSSAAAPKMRKSVQKK